MYPILLSLGPITIYSLWVFVAIGFFATLLILHKLIQRDRNKLIFIADHSLVIFFGGLIGARLVFILYNIYFFFGQYNLSRFLQIFYIWDKGLSIWGGILGITLSLIYFCKQRGQNIGRWLDIFIVSAMGGFVFGNIGAFLDGKNYGNVTSLPWGVIIDNSPYAIPIHPTQIYAAIYTLILTIILYQLYHHEIGKKEGNITVIGILAYSILRFLNEFLQGDESNYFLGMRENQILCLAAFIATLIIWYIMRKKSQKQPIPPAKGNAIPS